jgi:hypothetical protein
MIISSIKIFAIDGYLLKTVDYTFQEKWDKTVGSNIPVFSTCDTVFRKQYFYITAFASDYNLDKNNTANVEYSLKITKPDKSIYFEQNNLPVVKKILTNNEHHQMSDAILKMCFENEDALGDYTIEIEISDIITGKTKKIISQVILSELPKYEKYTVKDEDDFDTFTGNYFLNPQPEKALSYYIYYTKSDLAGKATSFLPVFSFFLEIAKNNSFLLPELLDCYKAQNYKTKVYLLYLLTYSKIGTDDFFSTLVDTEKDAYLTIKDTPLPDKYGLITEGTQLDMLWGTFLATGSYQPILKLVQTLDYNKYQGALEKLDNAEQKEEKMQQATLDGIYQSLVWSLKSNCKTYKLVKEYCNWALQYEKLSQVQKDELKKILEN